MPTEIQLYFNIRDISLATSQNGNTSLNINRKQKKTELNLCSSTLEFYFAQSS